LASGFASLERAQLRPAGCVASLGIPARGHRAIKRKYWITGLVGALTGAALLLVLGFPWSWFIPLAERAASNAVGRPVTIGGLHLSLGETSLVTIRDVTVANPAGFDAEQPFARIAFLKLRVATWPTLRDRQPTISSAEIQGLDVLAVRRADGTNNMEFATASPAAEETAPMALGELTLREGRVRILHAPLSADFSIQLETRPDPQGRERLVASASGTYAGAPLTARMIGGTILSVRDAAQPWPLEMEVENGTTRASLHGTISDPLTLAGADLRLTLAGPDMRYLTPLTGVPMPPTPPFRMAGKLSYADKRFHFTEIEGQVGQSDLGGSVTIEPRSPRPDVTMDIQSRSVDLADLAGVIGGNPGRGRPIRDDTPRTGLVLPNSPVNLPLFRAADMHARLRAARIIGAESPLDNLDVTLEIIDGVVTLKPLRGGVGRGAVIVTGTLTPQQDGQLHAVADIEFQRLDIARIMQSLGARGGGALSGRARIDSTGNSTAQLLGRGNGTLSLSTAGGNLSAFVVDLAGLRLGNAIFSAFGLPSRTNLECFVANFVLQRGVLNSRVLLLETSDAVLVGSGTIHLETETLDLRLRSEAKHFTIASLPASLAVRGRLSDPSVRPVAVARGGALDDILAPLSFIPTIEFGIGDDTRCEAMMQRGRRPAPERRPANR